MTLGRWLIAVVCVLGDPARALACGGGGVAEVAHSEVVADAQRVIISVTKAGTTETVVQIGVPSTNADYGVLIPTPSEPTLDTKPVDAGTLDALDLATRPSIVSEDMSVPEEDGCACLPVFGAMGGDDDSAKGDVPGTGVTASQPTNIGPVTAVTLTATDASALSAWLDDNGFSIPDERLALVDDYIGAGRYFIAIKRNDATAPGGPTSIGVHYTLQGDHRLLSLAFARLGAAPTVSFTLFLFAPEPAFPSEPFQALTLNDLDPNLLAHNDYTGAVKKAVKAHGAQAFVVEAGTPANPTARHFVIPASIADTNAVLVRMTTVLAADDLTEDAMFFAPGSLPIQNKRTLRLYVGVPIPASVGVLGFVALAWGIRRRRRWFA